LADLEALYGALSQKAFNGELDLSRVPMPTKPSGDGHEASVSPLQELASTSSIYLPETELLQAALEEPVHLEQLMRYWLDAYRRELDGDDFDIDRFAVAAQTRIADVHPDTDFEL